MRKICVVTGSRAEYGLLSGLMALLRDSVDFELQIVASAMHLSTEFGLTYREIEDDGFVINEKVEMLVAGDSAGAISRSMGLGVIGFTGAFERLAPDFVVILGDRFEALAAAQTAMMLTIPIAHVHGGEITEGAIDESIRHAISKMSNLHFVANEEFRRRVIQMGEQPARVFVSGAPGIDNIKRLPKIDQATLESRLNFKLASQNFLITYHPVTLSQVDEADSLANLFAALDCYPDAHIIITYPNADKDGAKIITELKKYAANNNDRVLLKASLGFVNYLSALPYMSCVIGNSSSGLLEVPSFSVPTVNIGDRQKGRLKAASVIDCDETEAEIIKAIDLALSDDFKQGLIDIDNPYGDGRAADTIIGVLRTADFKGLIRKPFYNINFEVGV